MTAERAKDFILETAGHTKGNLVCDSLDCLCGNIEHGLGLCFSRDRAGFVVSFEDWEKVYFAAKKLRDDAAEVKS